MSAELILLITAVIDSRYSDLQCQELIPDPSALMSADPFDFDTYKRNHAPSRSSIKKLDSALQMQHKFHMKTSAVHSRIEPETKKTAEGILRKLGLSPTDAIRLFYTQIALRNGLPFPVSIPNEETAQALEDSRKNKNLTTYATTDQLFESWDE